jgi:hypothetical protein
MVVERARVKPEVPVFLCALSALCGSLKKLVK